MVNSMKRVVLMGAALGGIKVDSVLAESNQHNSTRPNIVFIFSDDHATQAIGAYGGRFAKFNPTPNIDRIAKNGMRFERCYVTNSICGPSRATILTGKYNHLNGFYKNDMVFDGSQVTFPKLMRAAGYQTAIIGKWHLSSTPTGFDHYEVLAGHGGQGKYFDPDILTNGVMKHYKGYTTEIITKLGMKWLKEGRDKNKPFILMLQHKAPHRGWHPSPKYLNKYKNVEFPEPDTLFDDYKTRGTAAHEQDMSIAKTMNLYDLKLIPPGYFNEEELKNWHKAYDAENAALNAANLKGKDLVRWKYQRYVREYLRCIASVDDSVGDVLDYLQESGLDKNTVVIYSSDQGFYMGEHGWFDKRFMYEESLRTPLLVQWPGVVKPNSVIKKTIVSNLDFAETFLDIAGAKIPKEMQGASLVPILKGTVPKDWRTTFYYHYYGYPDWHLIRKHCGITDGRYKLIDFYTLGEKELYDREKDPKELNNLIDNPEYKSIVEKLSKQLKQKQTELKVPTEAELEIKFKDFQGENSYLKYGVKKRKNKL